MNGGRAPIELEVDHMQAKALGLILCTTKKKKKDKMGEERGKEGNAREREGGEGRKEEKRGGYIN